MIIIILPHHSSVQVKPDNLLDPKLQDLQSKLPQLLVSLEVRTDDIEFEENDKISQVIKFSVSIWSNVSSLVSPRSLYFSTFKFECKRLVSCTKG